MRSRKLYHIDGELYTENTNGVVYKGQQMLGVGMPIDGGRFLEEHSFVDPEGETHQCFTVRGIKKPFDVICERGYVYFNNILAGVQDSKFFWLDLAKPKYNFFDCPLAAESAALTFTDKGNLALWQDGYVTGEWFTYKLGEDAAKEHTGNAECILADPEAGVRAIMVPRMEAGDTPSFIINNRTVSYKMSDGSPYPRTLRAHKQQIRILFDNGVVLDGTGKVHQDKIISMVKDSTGFIYLHENQELLSECVTQEPIQTIDF